MAKAANKTSSYRYERKFFVDELTLHEVEMIVRLHPAAFSEIYHRRFVNNIYFDSETMRNYFDNVDGAADRVKVRVRWYGDLFGRVEKPVLEFKIKKGLLGRKESYRLAPFTMNEHFCQDTLAALFAESDLPLQVKLSLQGVQPTLLNRYTRKYFISANQKVRLTLDSDLEFYFIHVYNNSFVKSYSDGLSTVLELKYEPEYDMEIDKISNKFPFRMTRSSKYVSGIEYMYAW